MRNDGRKADELRKLKITRNYIKTAEGSVLIEMGDTRVICTATVENSVPPFLRGKGTGWVTAEYAMLPRSSGQRIQRERSKVGGRTHEIQRLIGRSLRSVVDMKALGERSVLIDCDVIQADGGTRTASITGAYIALVDALRHMKKQGLIEAVPVNDYLAAISVGIVDGKPMLDLCYTEDSTAEVDMNLVMTGKGKIVEVQGTAEGEPFSKEELEQASRARREGHSRARKKTERDARMTAFLTSLAIVVLAEMGDKTQLLAMAFASRFRWQTVMWGVFVATAANHLFAVLVGNYLTNIIPLNYIKIAASVSFIIFGLWTLRGDKLEGRGQKVQLQPLLDRCHRVLYRRDGGQDPACHGGACRRVQYHRPGMDRHHGRDADRGRDRDHCRHRASQEHP